MTNHELTRELVETTFFIAEVYLLLVMIGFFIVFFGEIRAGKNDAASDTLIGIALLMLGGMAMATLGSALYGLVPA